MTKKDDKHVHQWKRITYPSKHQVYRCVLTGCTTFINSPLLPGRFGICWRCKSVFVIKNINLVKPHCDDCTKKEEKKKGNTLNIDINKLTDLLT